MDMNVDIGQIVNFPGGDDEFNKIDSVNIVDNDWVSSRFMVSDDMLHPIDAYNRYASTADTKFTDSSIGGNIHINPRPQFTRYADIRARGVAQSRNEASIYAKNTDLGMGKYYSMSIDDNQQVVFMEFGVPKFNSLTDFFLNAIDYVDSVIANTGREPVMYNIGKLAGGVAMLAAFPLVTLSIWAIKIATKLVMGHGAFDYYRLDPTMPTYWGAVNNIVTNIAVELGMLSPYFLPENKNKSGTIGVPVAMDKDTIKELSEALPGIISPHSSYIDVFAIATKAQYRANRQKMLEYKAIEKGKINVNQLKEAMLEEHRTEVIDKPKTVSISDWFNSTLMFGSYSSKDTQETYLSDMKKAMDVRKGDEKPENKPAEPPKTDVDKDVAKAAAIAAAKEEKVNPDGTINYEDTTDKDKQQFKDESTVMKTVQKWGGSIINAFDASFRGGGAYAVFAVDYTGAASESISSTTSEIETGGQVKSLSKKSKDIKFNLAGGNFIEGADVIINGVKDFAAGALDAISFGLSSVLQTITGGGYINIPEKWDDSKVSLPQHTFNMQLISPYGNTFSQLQNIYIPLSMILAGSLPIATGKASYTSPYLCSLFSRGVQNTKLGMITSVTISRGTSNLGFNKSRRPLAVDVSFTVTDLSPVLNVNIPNGIFSEIFSAAFDDDSPLTRYVSMIGGRNILDERYKARRLKIRASKRAMAYSQLFSGAKIGMTFGSTLEDILGVAVSSMSITGQHTR